jgi:hypothetical protein
MPGINSGRLKPLVRRFHFRLQDSDAAISRIVMKGCKCKTLNCLLCISAESFGTTIELSNPMAVIRKCRLEIRGMTKKQIKEHIRSRIAQASSLNATSKRLRVDYTIGDAHTGQFHVCQSAFCSAFGIGIKRVPRGILRPAEFVKGSRVQLDKTVKAVKDNMKIKTEKYIPQWEQFARACPSSDDSAEHCQSNPMYVPFRNTLFSGCSVDHAHTSGQVSSPVVGAESIAMDSVTWSNRGNPLPRIPPLVFKSDNVNVENLQVLINQVYLQPGQDYAHQTTDYLKQCCNARRIDGHGLKEELAQRLQSYDTKLTASIIHQNMSATAVATYMLQAAQEQQRSSTHNKPVHSKRMSASTSITGAKAAPKVKSTSASVCASSPTAATRPNSHRGTALKRSSETPVNSPNSNQPKRVCQAVPRPTIKLPFPEFP